MATTPRGIVYPVEGNQVVPLESAFAAMATSADTAIGNVEAKTAALRGLDANKGAAGQWGREYHATDTKVIWFDTGSAWVQKYQTFTPVWSGLTIGNGTTSGYWWRDNNQLLLFAQFTMGSTSAITATVRMTLPVNAVVSTSPNIHEAVGSASVNRPGTFFAPLQPIITAAGTCELLALGGSGNVSYSAINSTTPGAWGAGAVASMTIAYRVANW